MGHEKCADSLYALGSLPYAINIRKAGHLQNRLDLLAIPANPELEFYWNIF